MSMSHKYKELRDKEIRREANKEWELAIIIIVYIILTTIFVSLLIDFSQAVAHYKAITTPAINHPPVFIR